PAERTGKSRVRYWPGGVRDRRSPASSPVPRRPTKPRVTNRSVTDAVCRAREGPGIAARAWIARRASCLVPARWNLVDGAEELLDGRGADRQEAVLGRPQDLAVVRVLDRGDAVRPRDC